MTGSSLLVKGAWLGEGEGLGDGTLPGAMSPSSGCQGNSRQVNNCFNVRVCLRTWFCYHDNEFIVHA